MRLTVGPVQNNKSKRQLGGGRKRSTTKSDDDKLVKRLKLGESVSHNERQMKLLDDLNLGMCILNDNDDNDDNGQKNYQTLELIADKK